MQSNHEKGNYAYAESGKKELERRFAVYYKLFTDFYGADRLILKAIKLDALSLVRSRQLGKKVLGLQRIVTDDPTLSCFPGEGELPALRSRCSAVYFEPLSPADIELIVENAARKLNVTLLDEAAALICRYTSEGRQAVNQLANAYGLALYLSGEKGNKDNVTVDQENVREVIQSNRLTPLKPPGGLAAPQTGKIYGLAAAAYRGSILEIEALAFPAAQPGRGKIRFNEAAGKMARDSVFNATSVLQRLTGLEVSDYNIHFNVWSP